jgi:IS30 family transposase
MEALLLRGEKQKTIATILKVDPSTICRELKRKRENGRYDAARAQMKAQVRRSLSKHRGMKIEGNPKLKTYLVRGLRKRRSPDEMAGRMRRDHEPFRISKNAIYRWLYSVYGQKYCRYLCTKRYRRRPRKERVRREMIPNRIDISLRPRGSENRSRYGHFEGDTIVAPRNVANTEAVAIIADRKSKLLVATRIPSLSASVMTEAVKRMEKRVVMKSCTLDNGIENKHHDEWPVDTFFCEPSRPSQKPLVEESIGLARRWKFKKGTDWSTVSEKLLQNMISFLNHKYRKSLKYQSAIEVAMAHGIMKTKLKD